MLLPCSINKRQKTNVGYKKSGGVKSITPPGCDKWAGFTIIELLVTVALIGIMTAVGVASYNNFNEKRIVKNAAEKLKVNIRYTQTKALAGEKDCGVCGANCEEPLVGWYVRFTSLTPPAQMEIYGECGTDIFFGSKTIDFNSALSLSLTNVPIDPNYPATNGINFLPLRQGTNLGPSNAEITVCAFGCGLDRTETVYVTPGGEIK